MTLYLGLGSNLGRRRQQLGAALTALNQSSFRLQAVSPIVESPALLPENFAQDWQRPYLNLVVAVETDLGPAQALAQVKQIERDLGRESSRRWSPRPIDIDLLYWPDHETESSQLTIPHPGISTRPFVLTPLLHLQPDLLIGGHTVLEWTRQVKPIPLFMAIINLTPDSFANDGWRPTPPQLEQLLLKLYQLGVHIIDFGAESTRPNATAIDAATEWRRLQPAFAATQQVFTGRWLKPLISIDSRHPLTIERALQAGADMVNDVSGLNNPAIMSLVKESDCQTIAMHSISVPVVPSKVLPRQPSASLQLKRWLDCRMESWLAAGLDINRIIFDPGIGFGKTPTQSLELLQQAHSFRAAGVRVLAGHSRKSFMNIFTDKPFVGRDPETLGVSLALCRQGVDIIRVHNAELHLRAYRSWAHMQNDY